MTRVYRVLRAAYTRTAFDGEGAYRYGGRWSNPGTRLVYTSEHQSLAMLEYFVHLAADDPPDDLVLATADVPDDLPHERIDPGKLPANWRETPAPAELARIGDAFVQKSRHVVLQVPSAIAASEWNWLLNPLHTDFKKIAVRETEPLSYDPRMFRKQGLSRIHRKK